MSQPVFRFAPSPNGYLHLGHAFSALYTWRVAARVAGTVLLRIEDIDTGRSRPHFVEQIFDDLKFLGLKWPEPVRFQSHNFDAYRKAARELEARGLLYPCFCNRSQVRAASTGNDPHGAPIYDGTCRALSPSDVASLKADGKAHSYRLDIDKAVSATGLHQTPFGKPGDWGDVVLVRKDTPTSYHLSVVVDDATQQVTHITRGMDMYPATSIHILLQNLLGLPTPQYDHHPLILDDDGRKLAKSHADTPLKTLRARGLTAEEIRHWAFATMDGSIATNARPSPA